MLLAFLNSALNLSGIDKFSCYLAIRVFLVLNLVLGHNEPEYTGLKARYILHGIPVHYIAHYVQFSDTNAPTPIVYGL